MRISGSCRFESCGGRISFFAFINSKARIHFLLCTSHGTSVSFIPHDLPGSSRRAVTNGSLESSGMRVYRYRGALHRSENGETKRTRETGMTRGCFKIVAEARQERCPTGRMVSALSIDTHGKDLMIIYAATVSFSVEKDFCWIAICRGPRKLGLHSPEPGRNFHQ